MGGKTTNINLGNRGIWHIQVGWFHPALQVNHFIAQLRTSHSYASRELDRLRELEKTYNKEYPTNHRRYVTTAQEVVSKMSIEVVKMSAVMTEKRKLAHLTAHDDQAQQLAFNRQIDAFIDDLEEKATESS